MKKKLTTAVVMLMLLSITTAQGAAPILDGEAEAHVWVDVVANLAVGVLSSNVDVGEIATGVFPAEIRFRVDANVEQVKFAVIASDLYKGDSPLSPYKIPVKTGDSADGALVQPDDGNAMAGHSNVLAWLNSTLLHDMTAWESEQVEFESGQGGHFSQDVTVTVEYDQGDPELPTGEYSGWVKLVCAIDPV